MRILVTSARMPFALAVMRRLCQAGHEVFSSDTYAAAPGNHSRYVTAHTVTASPRGETERFVEQVSDFCVEHGVELILPTWRRPSTWPPSGSGWSRSRRSTRPRSRRSRACTTSTRSSSSWSGSAYRSPTA